MKKMALLTHESGRVYGPYEYVDFRRPYVIMDNVFVYTDILKTLFYDVDLGEARDDFPSTTEIAPISILQDGF